MSQMRTPVSRFENLYIPEPNSGCWLWIGATNEAGYGRFYVNGKNLHAHRFSYLAFKGEVPEGMVLDHLCRVHCCVNPDHLEAVTNKENVRRGLSYWRLKKTCSRGHPYPAERNVHGRRVCNKCQAIYQRKYKARRQLLAQGG